MGYNKIILHGEQTCDYVYIQTDAPSEGAFSSISDEPSFWSDTTSLYANFNNKEHRLSAGDSEVIGSINGYEIYRKTPDDYDCSRDYRNFSLCNLCKIFYSPICSDSSL